MTNSHTRRWALLALAVFAAALAWGLWPGSGRMVERWMRDPRYSHGFLVPLFSLFLLWHRRALLPERFQPSWWGLALLALGAGLQLVGGFYRIDAADQLSYIPYLAGVTLLLGGFRALRWAAPALLFLVFMVPLPWTLEVALGQPLQKIATKISTYTLQTLGFMAFSEGFVIRLGESRIGVVDACSGLSMLMTFLAMSTAAALVLERPWIYRVILVLSSIPVALAANLVRIVVTGMLHATVGSQAADHFYHDLAGWMMILLALVLYYLELKLLERILVIEPEREAPLSVGLENLAPVAAAPGRVAPPRGQPSGKANRRKR